MTLDERNRMELRADSEAGKEVEIARLTAELAAAKERAEKAEESASDRAFEVISLTRQRDEMAAVVEAARVQAHHTATTFTVWRREGYFDAEAAEVWAHNDKEALVRACANPSAILAAALAKARREGAVRNGRKVQELARAGVCIALSRDVSRALEGIEQAVECIILAIERGEVEA